MFSMIVTCLNPAYPACKDCDFGRPAELKEGYFSGYCSRAGGPVHQYIEFESDEERRVPQNGFRINTGFDDFLFRRITLSRFW